MKPSFSKGSPLQFQPNVELLMVTFEDELLKRRRLGREKRLMFCIFFSHASQRNGCFDSGASKFSQSIVQAVRPIIGLVGFGLEIEGSSRGNYDYNWVYSFWLDFLQCKYVQR